MYPLTGMDVCVFLLHVYTNGFFLVILVENKALKVVYLYEGPAAISFTQEIDDYVQVLWSNILNTYLQR